MPSALQSVQLFIWNAIKWWAKNRHLNSNIVKNTLLNITERIIEYVVIHMFGIDPIDTYLLMDKKINYCTA